MNFVEKVKKKRSNLKNIFFAMEELISSNIKKNLLVEWNENDITDSLFMDMQKLFNGRKIHLPGNVIESSWITYKRKVEEENNIGKIALIFKITYHDGHDIEGVAFIDTKVKDPGKNTFSSLKKNQIRKMNSNISNSLLLLYDYDNISTMAFPAIPEAIISSYPSYWNNWIPFTNAVTLPADLAIALGDKTTGLYKVSTPFSYQLLFRYFFGLDLDYNNRGMDIARGYKVWMS